VVGFGKDHMDIVYLGHSSFRIKGKNAALITDPFNSDSTGLKFPKVEADIITVSHNHGDHNNVSAVGGTPQIVDGSGEYEIREVSIFGIHTAHDNKNGEERGSNTVYTISMDGIILCHLGDLGHKLSQEQLEEIGNVDVLFVPVGGLYTIDAQEAVGIISSIDPKVVIPMHYKVLGMKEDVYGALGTVEDFIKEIGMEPVRTDKLTIAPDKLPEDRQLVVFEVKG
jgi:L-ascorbate metabolism protein UlaG (beta-lactamase superfamily)